MHRRVDRRLTPISRRYQTTGDLDRPTRGMRGAGPEDRTRCRRADIAQPTTPRDRYDRSSVRTAGQRRSRIQRARDRSEQSRAAATARSESAGRSLLASARAHQHGLRRPRLHVAPCVRAPRAQPRSWHLRAPRHLTPTPRSPRTWDAQMRRHLYGGKLRSRRVKSTHRSSWLQRSSFARCRRGILECGAKRSRGRPAGQAHRR